MCGQWDNYRTNFEDLVTLFLKDGVLGPWHCPGGDDAVTSVGKAHPPAGGNSGLSGFSGEISGKGDVGVIVVIGSAAPFANDYGYPKTFYNICVKVCEQAVDIGLLRRKFPGIPVTVHLYGYVAGFFRNLDAGYGVLEVGVPGAVAASGAVSVHHKVPVEVVAAGCTHCLCEQCCVVVYGLVGTLGHGGVIVSGGRE